MPKLRESTVDLYDDELEWRDVFERLCRMDFDGAVELLATELSGARMRTYHGCRTDDVGCYFRDGLKLHHRESLNQLVATMTQLYPALHGLAPRLGALLERLDTSIDEGKCFVALDRRELLKNSAHYLIYGSEFVLAALAHYRYLLKEIGAPTLLHIELPLSLCEPGTLRELSRLMLQEWARLTTRSDSLPLPADFTFILHNEIPGRCFVYHEHPNNLRDPQEGLSIYTSDLTTCKYCAPNVTCNLVAPQ